MILLPILALSILVGLARGGRFANLERWQPRWGLLAGLALALQVGVVVLPLDNALVRALLLVSLGLLVTFVGVNHRLPGVPLLAVGLVLNLVAMAVNHGLMPVSSAALARAGQVELAGLPEGTLLEGSKDVLLQPEHARLWWLGDVISFRPPIAVVLSVGDLLVAAGGAWFLQRGLFPPGTVSRKG